ncbi:MAG TPA: glycosyltransferase family 39 protein [Solirubrobacteraceae bacterium]|nr:glycosyltransferase family 39 protein [Solirubrobacteraceae bacterium]
MSQGIGSSVTPSEPGSGDVPDIRGPEAGPAAAPGRGRAWAWAAGLAALLAAALGVRLWGVTHGLPYAYNADENAHFVPGAIGLFGHSANPHYFVNPPAFTYVLHAVFALRFGGRDAVADAYATDPGAVFVAARATAAVLGTLAVWLVYLTGARLVSRGMGVLAAALLAFAFLPVFYSHLALNDAPTLAPIALSLWGTAGVLRRGRTADYLVAGAGLGLACATKYTGGIVLLPLLGAAIAQGRAPGARTDAVRGLVLASLAALAAFVAANPYAVLDAAAFREGLSHQADASGAALGKLGLTHDDGWSFYLWTFTWGLGWAPLLAAAAGLVALLRDDRPLFGVLAPAPLLFVLFMGSQERFFGRWLLPVFPIVCLLAAYAAWRLVAWVAARRPALAPAAAVAVAVALCAQGVVTVVHDDLVLSRADTRNLTRDWMAANVPVGAKIVVEPGVVPDAWANEIGRVPAGSTSGRRWPKFPTSRSNIANDGSWIPGPGRVVNVEDYERTLYPGLLDRYERYRACWVVTGSTQRGRAEAQPEVVPRAVAYYRELERRGELVFEASPYRPGKGPVAFDFDWSFDFYPLAYERPGPVMRVYRLRGGRCASVS